MALHFWVHLTYLESLVAQLRIGFLPLAVEVGRFENIQEKNRMCELRDLREVENEYFYPVR